MGAGYREPALDAPDADAEERWRREVATAKARRAARQIRWVARLAFLTLLFAGLLGGCLAAGHVRGGDSPFSGLDDALERIGIGLLVGLATGLVARRAIVRRAQRRTP